MQDRDSINELFTIVKDEMFQINLPLAESAMDYIESHLGLSHDFDIYYRRRLSVCRTLIDLYLPVPRKKLDIILSATLYNHMPDDKIPEDHEQVLGKLFADEPEVQQVLSILRHVDYKDRTYYEKLVHDPIALIIRLAERAVLVEKLYEWHPTDAMRFVRETRESFFPMCLYAKEHYPEYLGAANILHEKMRNLTTVNEALLSQFMQTEYALSDEILALREENTFIRSIIKEMEEESKNHCG